MFSTMFLINWICCPKEELSTRGIQNMDTANKISESDYFCPPDNIPNRGGKAQGGHGGDRLASSPNNYIFNLCQSLSNLKSSFCNFEKQLIVL